MEAVYVLGGFGLSSIFYAVGGYLNELCIYLDNMGRRLSRVIAKKV